MSFSFRMQVEWSLSSNNRKNRCCSKICPYYWIPSLLISEKNQTSSVSFRDTNPPPAPPSSPTLFFLFWIHMSYALSSYLIYICCWEELSLLFISPGFFYLLTLRKWKLYFLTQFNKICYEVNISQIITICFIFRLNFLKFFILFLLRFRWHYLKLYFEIRK